MIYKVIGIENVDYTNKQNFRVQGKKFHCLFQNDDKIQGLGVESIYCKHDVNTSDISIDAYIEPLYNRYGQIASFNVTLPVSDKK